MKRLIIAALAMVVAWPAYGAMNIRQNGDGTAEWAGRKHDATKNCVGSRVLGKDVLLSTPSNNYLTTDISNAVITDVFAVNHGTTTGQASLLVYINQSTTPIRFINPSGTTTATNAALEINSGSGGTVTSLSSLSTMGATTLADNTVQAKEYINIVSDGGEGTTITARVFVKLCPR